MDMDLITLTADEAEVADALVAAAPTADERRQLASEGKAMKDGSYPIRNADDLDAAIKAVGRGGGSHDEIRRFIIKRARALGLESRIPDNWNSDGSMKASAEEETPLSDTTGNLGGNAGGAYTVPIGFGSVVEPTGRKRKALTADAGGLCELLDQSLASAAGLIDAAATIAQAIRVSYDAEEQQELADAPIMASVAAHVFQEMFEDSEPVGVITAAAILEVPAEVFEMPEPDEPTPLTVTEDGRVYGHAAIWGTCHTGIAGKCTTPPRSPSGYAGFHLGSVDTADGKRVAVGKITLDTGHAPMFQGSQASASHYDNTGTQAAYIRAVDGQHGIWFSGVLNPNLRPEKVHELKAATVSGDWRKLNGALEMIGLLAVNVPGFPVPRPQMALAASVMGDGEVEDEIETMVAAGILEPEPVVEEELDETTLRMRSRAAA